MLHRHASLSLGVKWWVKTFHLIQCVACAPDARDGTL